MNQSTAVLPGSTIGCFGSGQLGRMMAQAAIQMGYRVHIFSPEQQSPAGEIAHREFVGAYDDRSAVESFARTCDVITVEFENIPHLAAQAAAACCPVRPDAALLHTTQHRVREKLFLSLHGFPVTPFAPVQSLADFPAALSQVGLPAVLKTAAWGYDGKGQQVVETAEACETAFRLMGCPAILEAFVSFERELSVMVARSIDGRIASYPVAENSHRNHILDLTVVPAAVPDSVARMAHQIAAGIAEAIDLVGIMGVELFLTASGELLVNELAPRPHNSGHYTINACPCSQFEQQVRSVCGLPLGETTLSSPAAMVNLLGDIWQQGTPNWKQALEIPGVSLHLYGKREARQGRKMGHVTAMASSREEAVIRATTARASLLMH